MIDYLSIFNKYITLWSLVPDGNPLFTHNSHLLPVLYKNNPAMLKVALEEEEKMGGLLMTWWDGKGAARVFAQEDNALLLERATGKKSLIDMVQNGQDEEATRIICDVTKVLHAHKGPPPSYLLSLKEWFRELEPAALIYEGILRTAYTIASELLEKPQDIVVLHGDIHHENILDFKERGWLAIDPKHLIGERGFDYANIMRNPIKNEKLATSPKRFKKQVDIISKSANLDPVRLLKWTLAFSGLSAAWILGDGKEPKLDITIAELAAVELNIA